MSTIGSSAVELAMDVRNRRVSPVEVIEEHLERIEAENDGINAFVTVCGDRARERAREAERAVAEGEPLGPLHGVPVAIKDLQPVAGVRTTYGSKLYADHVPDEDGLIVRRLDEAGAIVLGKTNTPEFGWEPTTDNLLFGPTSTPFDQDKNAGGSSGGSAAAVAAGLAPIGQGSDIGGSLRIPASFCGVYGYKASFGRIPLETRPNAFDGHTPFLHEGPITRTVEDAALALDVLAGPHQSDPFSLPGDGGFLEATRRGVRGLSIAYSPDLGMFPIDERVSAVVDDAVDTLRTAGARVEVADVEFECSKTGFHEAFAALLRVNVAHWLRHLDVDARGRLDDLTPGVAEAVERGGATGAMEYKDADLVRTGVFDTIQSVFRDHDLLVTPTLAVPPFDNEGEGIYRDGVVLGPTEVDGVEIDPREGWSLTAPFNMTGHPAASIPAGDTPEGLPVGLQIVGPRHGDEVVLAASAALQRLNPWDHGYPWP